MFNAARLARMKRTAYLVNTARGGIIDEPALHAALTDGSCRRRPRRVRRGAARGRQPSAQAAERDHRAAHGRRHARVARSHGLQTAGNILSVLDGKPNRENVINREVLD